MKNYSKIKDFIIFFIFAAIFGWLSLLISAVSIPEKELFEAFCFRIVTQGNSRYPFLVLLATSSNSFTAAALSWFTSGLIVGFMRPGYSRKQYFVLGFAIICPLIINYIIEMTVNSSSHNLLFLEPIFYAICMFPAVVGLFAGSFLKNRGGRFLQVTAAVVVVVLIVYLSHSLSPKKEVQKASAENLWEEKNIFHPMYTPEKVWIKKIPAIIGMCSGDWNLDGLFEMTAITKQGEVLVIDETGKVKNQFPLIENISGNVSVALQWAKLGKDAGAITYYEGGWPDYIPVVGTNGKLLWCYPASSNLGINSAAWVDINGDGLSELLVGFNGWGGLHLVSSKGNLLWKKSAKLWVVAGIDAQGGRPGLALCTTTNGIIQIYDSQGNYLKSLPNEDHNIGEFAASEMSPDGTRQVVCLREVRKGTSYVVGMDLQGNVLWKYPVDAEAVNEVQHSIIAVDVTGDDTKEWILRSQKNELVVLDVSGRLILKLDHPAVYNFTSWGVLPRKNKSALIFCAGTDDCVAYTISSQK